jgi:hypothetical protein
VERICKEAVVAQLKAFGWKNEENHKNVIRTARKPAKIQTQHHWNTSQNVSAWVSLLSFIAFQCITLLYTAYC